MRQLIYTILATTPLSESDILNLLEKSQSNNIKHGIIGILIFFFGRFVQYIEGEDKKIEQLILNIQNDKRNTQFAILEDIESNIRNFPDWSMGYQLYTEIEIKEKLPLFAIRNEEDFREIKKHHKQLHDFLVSLYEAP